MERVKSYQEFGDKVKAFRKKARTESNCYFLPKEVRKMTEKGTLYLEESEDCLLFLVRETNCYRLYYYLREGGTPVTEKKDMPVFLDFVYKKETEEKEKFLISLWKKQGFQVYKKYRRMECLGENFVSPVDQAEMQKKYPIQNLGPENYEECIALWKTCLDEYSTILPDREEFTYACEKGQIMGVILPDGSVGAVDRGIFKGRTAFMQHLSVSPSLRGIGMGRTLCYASIAVMFTDRGAEKVNFWVDEKNTHAIGIYERMGFTYDGKVSGQLKLDKK